MYSVPVPVDMMRIMGVLMGGKSTEKVVNILDTVCLQPKVWNNLSNLLSTPTKNISQNIGVSIVVSRCANCSCHNNIFLIVLKYNSIDGCSNRTSILQNWVEVVHDNDISHGSS